MPWIGRYLTLKTRAINFTKIASPHPSYAEKWSITRNDYHKEHHYVARCGEENYARNFVID